MQRVFFWGFLVFSRLYVSHFPTDQHRCHDLAIHDSALTSLLYLCTTCTYARGQPMVRVNVGSIQQQGGKPAPPLDVHIPLRSHDAPLPSRAPLSIRLPWTWNSTLPTTHTLNTTKLHTSSNLNFEYDQICFPTHCHIYVLQMVEMSHS